MEEVKTAHGDVEPRSWFEENRPQCLLVAFTLTTIAIAALGGCALLAHYTPSPEALSFLKGIPLPVSYALTAFGVGGTVGLLFWSALQLPKPAENYEENDKPAGEITRTRIDNFQFSQEYQEAYEKALESLQLTKQDVPARLKEIYGEGIYPPIYLMHCNGTFCEESFITQIRLALITEQELLLLSYSDLVYNGLGVLDIVYERLGYVSDNPGPSTDSLDQFKTEYQNLTLWEIRRLKPALLTSNLTAATAGMLGVTTSHQIRETILLIDQLKSDLKEKNRSPRSHSIKTILHNLLPTTTPEQKNYARKRLQELPNEFISEHREYFTEYNEYFTDEQKQLLNEPR